MILCIVGPSCAGKTTSSKHICSKCDLEYVEASDYVRRYFTDEEPQKAQMESGDRGKLTNLVSEKFDESGKDFFAKLLWEDVNGSNLGNVIICGFRTVEEVEYIQSKESNVECIGIYSDSKTRYQRYLQRGTDQGMTYKEFIQKDAIEYDFGIAGLFSKKCDQLIMNHDSLEDFYKKTHEEIIDRYLTD